MSAYSCLAFNTTHITQLYIPSKQDAHSERRSRLTKTFYCSANQDDYENSKLARHLKFFWKKKSLEISMVPTSAAEHMEDPIIANTVQL